MKYRFLSAFACLMLAFGMIANNPKYVFLFIGDGMGMGHVISANKYYRGVMKNENHLLMMQFPVASMALTYSANNTITDSAAAGTALSTGSKTNNGMLGVTPDSVNVYSIAQQFKDKGYGVAIATSVAPDDATPAAFYAHQPSRSMYYEIGKDLATSNYDFFAGSDFRGAKKKDGTPNDLFEIFDKNGYKVIRGRDEVNQIPQYDKVILLSEEGVNPNEIGFTIDSVKTALTLPLITQQAISHLKRVSPEKFFVMIEGGNIDHAAHANDGGTVIKEIVNFNQALQEAYNFYLQHPNETLIVVTADHDTGGMTIGTKGGNKNPNFAAIDYQRMSKEVFADVCVEMMKDKKNISWDWMKNFLNENLGLYGAIPVSEDQDEELKEVFEEVFVKGDKDYEKTLYKTFSKFNVEVFDLLAKINGFGWTTSSHTGNLVPVFAIGVGAEAFSPVNNNIEIADKIRKISGIGK